MKVHFSLNAEIYLGFLPFYVDTLNTIRWKMFGIKVTFASIPVFRHFATNGAGESASGEPAQVLSGQVLQSGGLLCLHWVSAWNHQGQSPSQPPESV